jgi:hypothetical protein
MRGLTKINDRWCAGRLVGDKLANGKEGYHASHSFYVEWKRGPQGQGWFFGSNSSWKGPYKTSDEAYERCVNPPQPFGRKKIAA